MSNPEVNVGVVGATGLVGGKILDILEEREFPISSLRLFASSESAGNTHIFGGQEFQIEDASTADFSNIDLTLMSAGAIASKQVTPRIAEQGSFVVDNSAAWRMDPDVPLVVVEVNPDELNDIAKKIVANPNCTTMIAAVSLKPLHDHAGLRTIDSVTYQSASGAGQRGLVELENQTKLLMGNSGEMTVSDVTPVALPKWMFDNIISYRGEMQDEESVEEIKFRKEIQKIFNTDKIKVSASCVSVPVRVGHGIDLKVGFKHEILPEQARYFLEDSPGIIYEDMLDLKQCVGRDEVYVSRVRPRETAINGLSMFVAGDNIRKGAALNAVQIAEVIVEKHLS